MAKIFISYSRKDVEFAKRLTNELKKSDLDFWIDWEGIPPTVDWWREIEKGIEEADIFLFLISPDSAKSKICGQEIDVAVKNGKRIIPVVVREIEWQDTPPQLGHLNYIFFSRDDNFDTAINKLLTAVRTDYEWAAAHRRLQVKALEWERKNKEGSYLLRGHDLQEAEQSLAQNTSKDPHPTDLQREYVQASRQATDRQTRVVTGISIAGVIMLAMLAIFGFIQAGRATTSRNEAQAASTQAVANAATAQAATTLEVAAQATTVYTLQITQDELRRARNQALSAQSELIGSEAPSASILLALEAIKLNQDASEPISHESYQALRNALSNSQGAAMEGNAEQILTMRYSPDGRWFAVGGTDGLVRVWDSSQSTISGLAQFTLDCQQGASQDLFFSEDGSQLVTSGQGKTVCIWDMTAADPAKSVRQLTFELSSLDDIQVSNDGTWIVTGNAEAGKAILANVETGKSFEKDLIRVDDPFRDPNYAAQNLQVQPLSFAFSPDGTSLVVGNNFSMEFWSIATEGPFLEVSGSLTSETTTAYSTTGSTQAYVQVRQVKFSDDGKRIVGIGFNQTASTDTLFILNPVTYLSDSRFLRPPLAFQEIQTFAISPSGRWLAAGSNDLVWLWDLKNLSRDALRLTEHLGPVDVISFSPDEKWLVSASARNGQGDGTVRVWDLSRSNFTQAQLVLRAPSAKAVLSFQPQSAILTVSSENQLARFYDLADMHFSVDPIEFSSSYEQTNHPYLKSENFQWQIAYADAFDGTRGYDLERLVDLPAQVLDNIPPKGILLGFFPQEQKLYYYVCDDQELYCPAVELDTSAGGAQTPKKLYVTDSNFNLSSVGFTNDDRWGIYFGSVIGQASQWVGGVGPVTDRLYLRNLVDQNKRDDQYFMDVPTSHQYTPSYQAVQWSVGSNNKWLAMNSVDGTYILDMSSENPIGTRSLLTKIITLAMSPDNQRLVYLDSDQGDFGLLDLEQSEPLDTRITLLPQAVKVNATRNDRESRMIHGVEFSPDGRWVALTLCGNLFCDQDVQLQFWDVTKLEIDSSPNIVQLSGVSKSFWDKSSRTLFSSDGRWLGLLDLSGNVSLIDLSQDKPLVNKLEPLTSTNGFQDISFSPDYQWFLTLDKSGNATMMDLSDPNRTPILLNQSFHSLASIAFSKDTENVMLAGGTTNGKVLIWQYSDLIKNPETAPITLQGGSRGYDQLAFSPDNKWILAAGKQEPLKAWRINLEDVLNFACTAAGRNFSVTEWAQYGFTEEYRATCEQWPISTPDISAQKP